MKKPPEHPPLDSAFKLLLYAIVYDDCKKTAALLKRDPSLAMELVDQPRLYRGPLGHWLYAKDTALHLAAAGYRCEIARDLLKAGTDPNAAQNMRRSRPLHYAADGNPGNENFDPARQVKMIQLLLKAGAEIDAPDKNGATALHRAVRTRCAQAVECLLKAGADFGLKNKPGSAAFHLAVQNTGRGGSGNDEAKANQRRIIKALLTHGANPKAKDANGLSVFDWAKNDEIRSLL
jgi:ankyrin repeat protein